MFQTSKPTIHNGREVDPLGLTWCSHRLCRGAERPYTINGAPKVQAKPFIGEILVSRMAGKVHLDPELSPERDVKLFQ